jgi:hypothetical protein
METRNWKPEIGNGDDELSVVFERRPEREPKPSEPNTAKSFDINWVQEEDEKRTQMGYPT